MAYLFDNRIVKIGTCSGTLSTAMSVNEIDSLDEVMLADSRKIKAVFRPRA